MADSREEELSGGLCEGDRGGSAMSELPPTPTHVFFDGIFWAREGEAMEQFLSRLKTQELASYSWMFPTALIQELQRPSARGSVMTFDQEVSNGIVAVQMHRHDTWRKKL